MIFLLVFFIATACSNSDEMTAMTVNDFYSKTSLKWLSGINIESSVKNGLVDKPIGGETLLFQINYLDSSNQKVNQECVYYLVPLKKILGELTVLENKDATKCSESPAGKLLYKIKEINSLAFNFENFYLNLNIKTQNNNHELRYSFLNISNGVFHERFRPMAEKKILSGAVFYNKEELSTFTHMSNYIGHIDDSYSNKTSVQCFKINAKCEVSGENFCERCKYGSFEVVDYRCPQGGSRFCGINHCGEKNEPACIRGMKTLDDEQDGICNNNLKAIFNGDHVLVCQ